MAGIDQTTLAPQIARAKAAGYSDDEIVNHLSQGIPEIKKATSAGYNSGEIIQHLGGTMLPAIVVDEPGAKKQAKPEPADDHGLARRQAMSPAEKAISPITEYPRNYEEMRTEAEGQVGRGMGQIAEGWRGGMAAQPGSLAGLANLGTFAKGAANVGLGALGYVGSPALAAYRSIAGQPLEDVTGIPREQTEFAAQLLTPGIGFTRLARAPGVAEPVPLIRPPAEVARPDVAEAAQRVNEISPVAVPRAVTGSRTEQQLGQNISNIPAAGQPISEAIHTTLPQQLERARNVIAAEHGEGTGGNVANRVGVTLQEQAAAEEAAAKAAAAQQDAQATAEWQRAQAEREAAIAQQEQQATATEAQSGQTAQQAVGPALHPQDMGNVVIDRTRAAHDAARAAKDAAYREAGAIDATVLDEANGGAHGAVNANLRSDLGGQGTVDLRATAASSSRDMMGIIQDFSNQARQRRADAINEAVAQQQEAFGRPLTRQEIRSATEDAAPTGQSMRNIEQLRQDLNFHASGASNDADRRAATRIIHAFDDWHGNAVESSLMPGSDPGALEAMQRARALNHDFRTRFGYNNRDDADKLINKIVRGEEDQHTGPVGVSNALTAGGDKSGPLFTRIMQATGNSPDVAQAVRSGTWHKLTRDAEGLPRDAAAIRRDVITHLYGKGRDVAERVFSQQQRDLMRAHADTVVQSEAERVAAAADRKAAARLTKSTEPVPTKVEPGPIQQLVEQVIGGKSSDEALFKTLHGYAKKGGDVKTLARVMQQLPAGMRGDLGSAFIREMGVSPTTKQFSLDHFANHWNGLGDQAKAVMFGNAGPHVTALNDIATIAQRLKEVKGRFGNPSGSAQNVLFGLLGGLGTQSLKAAAATAATGVGANVAARVLASPAGASSIAKYARAVERANRDASLANMTAVKLAQRNVENTTRSLAAVSGKQ